MKGKKTIFILATLLSLSIPAAFSSDSLAVEYTFNATVIDGQWVIEDTFLQEIAGEPVMPYYPASILLPQGAVVKDVKVKFDTPVIQDGFELPWGQYPCTFSGPKPEKVGPNPEIYNSNNWYPEKLFEVVGVSSYKGFQILNVNLYPLQYQPSAGKIKFYPKLIVEVQFGKGLKNKLYRGLADDKAAVAGIVDNTGTLSTYEDGGTPLQTEEYIIITSSSLTSTFQTLATWKGDYLNGAAVYDTTYIYNNYTGVDNQEKIRNFIIDKYTYNGTKYVLLGGDTGVVPYRGLYVSSGGYTDSDMASDMYYGHLDGNWNNDGDSRYAEPGEEDWYAEVAVGRAPVDNSTEAQAFVNKVIAYEQMEKPDVGARKRVCFHESRVMSGNDPDARCLAYNCDDWIPGDYYVDYLFEEDQTISKTVWRNAWAAEPIVVVHIGHGNTSVYHINYEIGGTVSWYNSDVPSLTNAFYPWTTSVACICGEFEASDCLAEEYVKDDCGAIGAIYNDNYGWFSTLDACKYSGEFCEMEIRACWSDGLDKLGELRDRSRYYLASSANSNSTYRWCYYERNLMGDPETSCLNRPIYSRVFIINPQDGDYISGTSTIMVGTIGCIDAVEFYIDGVLEYTDTTEPFTWDWDTTLYTNGPHTILVKGYCAGEFKDDDQITVFVHPYHNVTITEPHDGDYISGTTTIAVSTIGCIDAVEFYIDGVLEYTDTTEPFTWDWDTTLYTNGPHTILVKGYCAGEFKDDDQITVFVRPYYYVTITEPQDGDTVSGHVWIHTDVSFDIDTVEFYIDGVLEDTDTEAPFEWRWNTHKEREGTHTITVKGYASGTYRADDLITVAVDNKKNRSIGLLSLLVLFIPVGIYYGKR
ncbi:MAG: hypothetical protein HXS46_00435 [Theionarchaea archaeon]|nr:hypothetical protein [Theionarchaea archaeon]